VSNNYDLVIKGKDGADAPNPKTNGINGDPLGPSGNGAPGEASLFGKCKKQAGVGLPGNRGDTAPPADSGENADDAYSVVFKCMAFEGTSFSILVAGGKGGNGGDGGVGGDGSAGGDAGKQPKECTEVINGGIGGNSGAGGNAGNGGCGGNAGNVAVICGPSLSPDFLSTENHAGGAGLAGSPGDGGKVGLGGKNSDGTLNSSGGRSGGGSSGWDGTAGQTGNVEAASDSTKPPTYLEISVKPVLISRAGCGS
jgi:hypothetical protein